MKDWLRARARELRAYVHPARGTGAVLLADYRTGSTLLASLLGQHPRLDERGDLFLDFMQLRLSRVLNPLAFVLAHPGLCTLRAAQLERVGARPGQLLAQLAAHGWPILYLRRRSLQHQALSNLLARQQRRWHRPVHDPRELPPVRLDPTEYRAELQRRQRVRQLEGEALVGLAHLALVYEDDLQHGYINALERCFQYLGLPPVPVQPRWRPTSSLSWDQRVLNLGELGL